MNRAPDAEVRTALAKLPWELPAEARAGWAAALVDFPNTQAKDADGRGMPGSEVMTTYIQIVADSGYDWPVDYTIE